MANLLSKSGYLNLAQIFISTSQAEDPCVRLGLYEFAWKRARRAAWQSVSGIAAAGGMVLLGDPIMLRLTFALFALGLIAGARYGDMLAIGRHDAAPRVLMVMSSA